MKWAEQVGVTYSIKVSPLVPIIMTESVNYQLTISYNTEYNLSVVAIAPCRPNATVFVTLRYGEVYWLIICTFLMHIITSS